MNGYKLDDDTYEYIKEVACHTISHYEVRCIPISGFEIAEKLNITLIPYSSLDDEKKRLSLSISTDGFFIIDSNKEMIFYNDKECSYERINMTILHEIGHIQLDHSGNNPVKEEAEASFFAKYIIAPPPLVHYIHPTSSIDIYNNFDISFEASINSFNYYKKWYRIHFISNKTYTSYEKTILTWYYKSQILMKGGDTL